LPEGVRRHQVAEAAESLDRRQARFSARRPLRADESPDRGTAFRQRQTPGLADWPGALRKRTLKKWEKAGLTPLGFHEGRHTFASIGIAAGINAKILSTYLGHATITITLDRYGHLMPGSEVEARALLDSYLDRPRAEGA